MEYFNEDKIFSYFEEEIRNSSLKDIQSLKKEIKEIKENELKKIHNEVKQQIDLTLKIELKDLNNQRSMEISKISNEYKLKLMKVRENLLEQVFSSVKEKLNNFTNSNDYVELMKEKVKNVNQEFANEKVIFKINKDDKRIRKIIESNFLFEYDIEVVPEIYIGGFEACTIEKGLEIDETIDTKLNEKKQWFYSNSKLFIRY